MRRDATAYLERSIELRRTTIFALTALTMILAGQGATSSAWGTGGTTAPIIGVALLGQTSESPNTLPSQDVGKLLKQARTAIQDGRLKDAEQWIARAEKSGVKYNLFHVGDTPQKARWALEKAKKAASKPPRTNPFTFGGGQSQTSDPFASRDRANTPFQASPLTTPKTAEATARGTPGLTRLATPSTGNSDAVARSAAKLRGARLSLAVGDTRRAEAFLAEAKKQKIQYGLSDDSPAKVEAAIVKYKQVQQNRSLLKSNPAWQSHYAQVLREQSLALLAWKEFNEAERLALDSIKLDAKPLKFGESPQSLLDRIATARSKHAAGQKMPGKQQISQASGNAKRQTLRLLAQARSALTRDNLDQAERFAMQASTLNVPESAFTTGEDRPSSVALSIHIARMKAASSQAAPPMGVVPGVYRPGNDSTRTIHASKTTDGVGVVRLAQGFPAPQPLPATTEPIPLPSTPVATSEQSEGFRLITAGEEALRNRKMDDALRYFRQAYKHRNELDPISRQRLQGHLQMLSVGPAELPSPIGSGSSFIDAASDREKVAIRQLSADVTKKQMDARRLREREPGQAIKLLKEACREIESATVSEAAKSQLLRRVDLSLGETETYIEQNRAQLEMDAKNKEVLEEIDRGRRIKVQTQEKTKELVDQYNTLRKEQRYSEMEVVAQRLHELAPDELVAQVVWTESKNLMAMIRNQRFQDDKAVAFDRALWASEKASVMMDPDDPFQYGDVHAWKQLTNDRKRYRQRESRLSERELEIQRRLRMPVQLRYTERPLSEVVDNLSELAGINIHLDSLGLSQEGVRTDTPVTINLTNEISLESALNLILGELHLSYVIKDEVLKITSEGLRDNEIHTEVYNVADLVIPIPNFMPGANVGLQGLINDAHASMGYGFNGAGMPGPMAIAANDRRHPKGDGSATNPDVLAQQMGGFSAGGPPSMNVPIGGGPGGLGGGSQADFDALIELIKTTVHADSWDDVGGPGSVKEFSTNLSLVVSQTQEVHEEIADLLEQLRRLQDLQVTIEVRFITLSDTFFERIGIDFDFNIEDGPAVMNILGVPQDAGIAIEGQHRSSTVGLQPPAGDRLFPNFTTDLDIPFRNEAFNLAVAPAIGAPAEVATFGFAILSDIEAYFLVSAAQGDRRSNILEAPKVTLFNGQQAFVSDTVQKPFVISVIPVVGDFAAAQQPVIVVLSEGTFMTIQAVVSDDRRYVRLTVVPFFSQIGEVREFTFEGSTTSSRSSSSSRDNTGDENPNDESEDEQITRSGTTVQLPTFEFVSISTTVSVPDGGTVLLGGIKRLEEGRNEFGVPLLSKVPYINRLFKNTGIARSTTSLMMMVTPRIIIQEEEEERLGIINE